MDTNAHESDYQCSFASVRGLEPQLAFSGSGSASCSGTRPSPAFYSSADSELSVSFRAPANNPVNSPPLRSVLRKNVQVGGFSSVPRVSAWIQPANVLGYSGLYSQEAVLVIR